MTTDFRTLVIALAVLVSAPVAAQAQNPPDKKATSKNERVDRAKERCRLNHGVDCDTPEGLKEWLLLERSRKEAVREGSRHLPPAQPRPAPSRP
jgi:aminoglycoside phosphotransferase (APT) family kinase protein